MVYQQCVLELPYREIAGNLGVDHSTVHEHPHQKLTLVEKNLLLCLVLDRPNTYLHKLQRELSETTGTSVSISTICNFRRKSGFTRCKLTRVALQMSDELRAKFRKEYTPEMLVFIDETGSDRRDAQRRFGYSLRGKPARSVQFMNRGNTYPLFLPLVLMAY